MTISKHHHIETIYVQGTYDEFRDALAETLQRILDENPNHSDYELRKLSHSIAVDAGRMHWSAILEIHLTFDGNE